jgi:hypothetical protein
MIMEFLNPPANQNKYGSHMKLWHESKISVYCNILPHLWKMQYNGIPADLTTFVFDRFTSMFNMGMYF